nr:hypothetical protein [Tanacetum cinerariifolium]
MVHPSDGKAWKLFDLTHLTFSKEIQNVRLGLCTEGFNPNNLNSNPYSLWPVFLTIYNLLPWMSLKDVHVKLSLVIPGRKNPGQNLDVFLQSLIKELKTLWNDGVKTYDAYRKNNFNMKATLLWTVSDFPAYAMLLGWSTHGKLACPYCMSNVDSFQLHNGGKPCWFDCHQRFLPARHPYRRDIKGFFPQKSVFAGPPPQLTGIEIWQQIRHLPSVYEGEPYRPKIKKIDGFGQTHNWVKRSIFRELPYWHTLLIRHSLDVMHTKKNFFENLFHTIMGSLTMKDNVKARKDVELYCDIPELHMFKVQNTVMKPKASYTLNKTQLHKVCVWMTKLKFPDGKLGSLKRTVRNKARVEGSIVQNYLLNELFMHCSLYFDPRIETHLNRELRNFALDIHCSSPTDTRLNIFKVPTRRIFDTGTKRNLTNAEKHKAHTSILLNCEYVHPFLKLFDNYIMQEDPYIDEETLDRARDKIFAQWFKEHIQSNGGNKHLKILERGPMRYVESHKGYFVNGYKFHTLKHGDGRVTHNSEVCVKGSTYNEFESDYYGLLVDVLEVNYRDRNGPTSRSIYEVTQSSSEVVDDNVDVEEFFQENKMPTCSNTTIDANENTKIEKVADLEVGDAYMKVSENEELFVDTYENLEVNETEEEFIDRYDDLDDENELALSDHSSDEDEVNLSDHSSDEDEESWLEITIAKVGEGVGEGEKVEMEGGRSGNRGIIGTSSASDYGSRSRGRGRGISGNIGIGGSSSNVSSFGNQEDANYDNGSRSGGRGSGISGNIGIGGSSCNVSRFGNQEDANYDNGSRSGGKGSGISGNIGIGGSSSNVSRFGNQKDADYDNGSRSGGRGRGRSGNIDISDGSNVSEFRNQDVDYDNGSRSGGRGRGISGNISGRGSCCTSRFGNPDADFDTNDNETETETSKRREVDQESRDFMFEEFQAVEYIKMEKKSNVARQNRLTEVDGEVSKHTAGSKTILQHKFQMEKEKKRHVSLLEAYHRTHTITNVSSEAPGSGMDEASKGRTREMPLRLLLWRNIDQTLVSIYPMTLIYRERLLGGGRKVN